ncbi:adenylate/guanylate cyclase domain-containing protein [Bradyrhizobium sp. WSM1743]|uniref:adenylate/guanylate cyclase domain-containing protein n=1 Tax=Bradyrhizobium sp. WSM1743 TaxID=318996 RepID=UPI0004804D2F|nr:adenylate/guanylate cyclase domain-containing protein [Bradyrhizobium sp. WSM1743]
MDVEGWLRRLGLEQYEAAFRENKVDDTVLPSLTSEDLKDLGVEFVGHRRKLLEAISALRAEASAPTPLSKTSPVTDKARTDSAERRQVTVMFADLVGSTALSARMDPEDLREVISAYQTCVADTVCRFGGFVAKYMGDGVLIYFGYPAAHEDDAERAVRAGVALIDAVAALSAPEPLQVRIGAATGLVVVGDSIGSGEAREWGIVGETPNLAARLQAIAEPNTVVIGESTRRLLGDLFELQDLGPKDVKGIARPVRAFIVLQASSIESRFEAMHPGGLTALVGREEELEVLLRRWRRTKTGEGQAVLLSGEAGIGKSRLSAALLEHLAVERHTRLRYFCSAQHTDSALYPIIGQMEHAAGLARDDKPASRLDKLDTVLARTSTSIEDAALFAAMLSLPNDGRYPTLELAPQQRRERTLEALISQLEVLTCQSPVLMIFEDAHWADPTSLEVLDRVVERIRTLRVLVLVTFRPEFERSWFAQPHVTALTINRLAECEASAMIDQIVDSKLLPESVRQDIIERTDGVPLFVEEMTKAVLEAGGEDAEQRTLLAAPLPVLAVPASLHASLMARLDRLGVAKEVAQTGGVIGREFSYELLAAVSGDRDEALQRSLERLVHSGLILRRGTASRPTFLFKHALVQDAAYSSLLRSKRSTLHGKLAHVLEHQFPERAEAEPELVAHHFTEAGQVEPGISYWLKAGRRAAERSASAEALRHLSRGLALLLKLPDSIERDQSELEFQVALGTPLVAAHGWASPEVATARARAAELCEKLGDPEHLLPVLFGQAIYCINRGKTLDGLGMADRCWSVAKNRGDRIALLVAHRAMGSALLQLGRFADAKAHLEPILRLHDPERDRALASQYVVDPAVSGGSFCALALWILGYPDKASTVRNEVFSLAPILNHANSSAFACFFAGAQLSELLGDLEGLNGFVKRTIELSQRYQLPTWNAHATVLAGWALAQSGQLQRGIILCGEGIAKLQKIGTEYHLSHYFCLLAIMCARIGDHEASLRALRDSKNHVTATKEHFWEAELHRTEGEIGLSLDEPINMCEECFLQAMNLARKQQAKSFELRAAVSLARLWKKRNRVRDARDLITPLYGWFTEGFETCDLKEAKALLDELA